MPSLPKLFSELGFCPFSADHHILNPDKLGLKFRFTVFEKHLHNFTKIPVEIVKRFPLGMGPGETGDVAYE